MLIRCFRSSEHDVLLYDFTPKVHNEVCGRNPVCVGRMVRLPSRHTDSGGNAHRSKKNRVNPAAQLGHCVAKLAVVVLWRAPARSYARIVAAGNKISELTTIHFETADGHAVEDGWLMFRG